MVIWRCGGHLTFAFSIDDGSSEMIKQGSRGFGLSIKSGVEVSVKRTLDCEGLSLSIEDHNGNLITNEDAKKTVYTTLDVLSKMGWFLGRKGFLFHVKQELPPGRGFAVSASTALATSAAVIDLLCDKKGQRKEDLLACSYEVAHLVERINSGGLGDITGIFAGGVELRTAAGSPTHICKNDDGVIVSKAGPGESEGWFSEIPVLLLWGECAQSTGNWINHLERKKRITEVGDRILEPLLEKPWNVSRWPEIIELSHSFAKGVNILEMEGLLDVLSMANRLISDRPLTALPCFLGAACAIVPTKLEGDYKHYFHEIMEEYGGMNMVYTHVCEFPLIEMKTNLQDQ